MRAGPRVLMSAREEIIRLRDHGLTWQRLGLVLVSVLLASRGDAAVQAQVHAKGQRRMASASASRYSAYRPIRRSWFIGADHTEGRLTTTPNGCCVRKGTYAGVVQL
jgi:hypothetical protein